MKNKNVEIINDFLFSSPGWIAQMKLMKQDSCMICGANPRKIEDLCKALKEERDKSLKVFDWATGDDTGISSRALCRFMLGFRDGNYGFLAPCDAGDRGRCIRLLLRVPEWIERIDEIAVYSTWREQLPMLKKELEIAKSELSKKH